MEQLIILEVMDNIVADYSRLGTCLLHDKYGNMIKKLEINYVLVEKRVEEMFRLWIERKGRTNPVSWLRLVECLRYIKLNRLADEIELEYCVEEEKSSGENYAKEYRETEEMKDDGEDEEEYCNEDGEDMSQRCKKEHDEEERVNDEGYKKENGKQDNSENHERELGVNEYEKEYGNEVRVSNGEGYKKECGKEEKEEMYEKGHSKEEGQNEKYRNAYSSESLRFAATYGVAITIITLVMYLTNCLGKYYLQSVESTGFLCFHSQV